MAHARKTIRDRIVADLTGLTTTGTNVFKSRVYPIAGNLLPGLAIYTLGEQIEYASIGQGRLQQRMLSVSVDIYVKGTSNYDDTLDQICLEIEDALYADLDLNSNAKDVRVSRFDSDFSGEGDQPVAFARLGVDVIYHTNESDPETTL
jgi:hypothetical protein